MANQLTFDLALPPPTYAREDFIVAPANREALAWIDRWPDWPAPALALGGPPGCARAISGTSGRARAAARVLDGGALEGNSIADLSDLAAASPAIMIDNAERAPERALFHLYNLMRERRGHLLLVSTALPAHWSIALPDLASRLRAAPAVAVAPPDDELLGSIILKQLADRQLHAGAGVVHYLVSHMERSADSARPHRRRARPPGAGRTARDRSPLAADVLAELSAGGWRSEKADCRSAARGARIDGLCATVVGDRNLADGLGAAQIRIAPCPDPANGRSAASSSA